jgi:hypothetical protein
MVVHAALLLTAVSLFAGKAGAQDSGCKAVVVAAVLQARTPSHVYSSMTHRTGHQPDQRDHHHQLLRLHEEQCKRRRSMEKDELLARGRGRQAAASSRAYTSCQHVGDETINGEAAAIYTER